MKRAVTLKTIRRKPIKKKKLGLFSEWHLHRKGKKDCKNHVFKMDSSGNFASPFLKQEISLCSVAVQHEKELLAEIIMDVQSEIEALQLHINSRQRLINGIDQTQNAPTDLLRLSGEEALTDDVLREYHTNEFKARMVAREKQIGALNQSIETISADTQKYSLLVDKEVEVTQIRCNQLRDILIAKLSAYWTGTLRCGDDSREIPPIFAIDDLLAEIKSEIDSISK